MCQQDYINEYYSKNHQIREGYAYAIATQWYKNFERFLQNMSGVDVSRLPPIENRGIYEDIPDQQINLDHYQLFNNYSLIFNHQQKIKSNAKILEDFHVVSIDIWQFLKKYHGADFDVVVFITKLNPDIRNYYLCDNLEDGLCVNMEIINVSFVIVPPSSPKMLTAIKTGLCKWMDLTKLRAFIMALHYFGEDAIRVTNEACLYFQNKKVPFRGTRTLEAVGINCDMPIIMSCLNLTLQDIEEEIETDGEEHQVEQNVHTKYEFLQLLDEALQIDFQNDLQFKTIEEIQKALEQDDFFQI